MDVSTVHDVEGGWSEDQLIQEGDIVSLPMSDADQARDKTPIKLVERGWYDPENLKIKA